MAFDCFAGLRRRWALPNGLTNWKSNSNRRPTTSLCISTRKRSTRWPTIRWEPYKSGPCCRFTSDIRPGRRGGPSRNFHRHPGLRRYLPGPGYPPHCPGDLRFLPNTTRRSHGTTWVSSTSSDSRALCSERAACSAHHLIDGPPFFLHVKRSQETFLSVPRKWFYCDTIILLLRQNALYL